MNRCHPEQGVTQPCTPDYPGHDNWDTAAYDAFIQKPLRTELFADMLATVKPTNQTHNGASVTFNYKQDLADRRHAPHRGHRHHPGGDGRHQRHPDPERVRQRRVTTAKLRGTAYASVDTEAAETVGRNAGESIDSLIMTLMGAGTNVKYHAAKTTRISLAGTDTLTAPDDALRGGQAQGRRRAPLHPQSRGRRLRRADPSRRGRRSAHRHRRRGVA